MNGIWVKFFIPVLNRNLHFENQFSKFEIAFAASTRCLCVFILHAGRHPMLLPCANMYVRTGYSNTKYNMKYHFLRDTADIQK